jgi:3-deoxy-7-phosphoheptulonate synthase
MLTRTKLLTHQPLIIAGPCSISSKDQIFRIAREVKKRGAHVLRAQLWKPRTKPGTFQGVEAQGLQWLAELKKEIEIKLVMEVTGVEQIKLTQGIADILWVGARNMQNYELLKALSHDQRPVILKRAFIATIQEWLGAADYIGRDRVILCERGIRTGADSMRFTLDLNTMLVAQHDHEMPVLIDPSHTAGRRDMVSHLAHAAIAAGANGLIIETHYNPEEEKVDRDQTINLDVFSEIVSTIKSIHTVVKEKANANSD